MRLYHCCGKLAAWHRSVSQDGDVEIVMRIYFGADCFVAFGTPSARTYSCAKGFDCRRPRLNSFASDEGELFEVTPVATGNHKPTLTWRSLGADLGGSYRGIG